MPSDNQKSTFFFNKTGNSRKKTNEGITNQNTPCDSSAIFKVSFVSMYIQTKASKDTKGIEATILPIKVLRFETSVMATIITDDNNTLMI